MTQPEQKDMPPEEDLTLAQRLAAPTVSLAEVDQRRAGLLANLKLHTVGDLLFFFPRDYQDLSDFRKIDELEEDVLLTVRGTVEEIDGQSSGFGRSRVGVLIRDETNNHLRATWFNQPFIRGKFSPGQYVMFSAKATQRGGRWEMSHPRVIWLDGPDDQPKETILPVYSLTDGITQYHMRRMVMAAVKEYGPLLEEVFPQDLLDKYHLAPLGDALQAIHQPTDDASLATAKHRFIFQELFILQLALVVRRWQQQLSLNAPMLEATAQINARIERLFPFDLTNDQRKVIKEVAEDMALDRPMNRLLQGDVGSGKTVIAVYAMLLCVANGHQAVLMAPTEILAQQHAKTLDAMLTAGGDTRVGLLTGGMPTAERAALLEGLASGEIDVVIGTHAILQDDVKFAKPGLVVIDEQHKFGVKQRAALREGNTSPHYLVMTATPIPRTVSMTLFGDLDVSILREKPAGRQEVSTYLIDPTRQERWWNFVREKLRAGEQAYVVAPLVDESETISAASVSQAFEELSNGELEAFRVALLHGRMSSREKVQAMADFREGKTQVLVSTSVIEVGVDVAAASIMIINSAERFGLAQLHQLRGRIGRGTQPGYCGVLINEELSEQGRERLTAFSETHDGFELAEIDFDTRGPGDLLGTQQHGLPPLRVANLSRDRAVLEEARKEAQALVANDPGLRDETHAKLRRQMLIRYGNALELGDVG